MIDYLWAKSEPYQSLKDHMLESGYCAIELLSIGVLRPVITKMASFLSMSEEHTCKLIAYLVALHDIGKCHPRFQAKNTELHVTKELICRGMLTNNMAPDIVRAFRHEQCTKYIIKRIWVDRAHENMRFWDICAASLSASSGETK